MATFAAGSSPPYRQDFKLFGKSRPRNFEHPRHATCDLLAQDPGRPIPGQETPFAQRSRSHRAGRPRSGRLTRGPASERRFHRTSDRHIGAGAADPRPPPRRAARCDRRLSHSRPMADAAGPHVVALAVNGGGDCRILPGGILARQTWPGPSISTWRCALRMPTIKPASTSTSAIDISRKNVEVAARSTNRNSTSMPTNSAIARM